MAEFRDPDQLLAATQEAYQEGYRRMDAYSPFPVEGLSEALHIERNWLPYLVLAGGILGALAGYGMQYYTAVIAYPHNVGGRPLNSWPAFIPITFEMTVLFAAFAAVVGMLVMNGLPRPYHPVFNVPRFKLASRDRFFLVIHARDPQFDQEQTHRFLAGLGADEVYEVER
jgi:hypothetical protein